MTQGFYNGPGKRLWISYPIYMTSNLNHYSKYCLFLSCNIGNMNKMCIKHLVLEKHVSRLGVYQVTKQPHFSQRTQGSAYLTTRVSTRGLLSHNTMFALMDVSKPCHNKYRLKRKPRYQSGMITNDKCLKIPRKSYIEDGEKKSKCTKVRELATTGIWSRNKHETRHGH